MKPRQRIPPTEVPLREPDEVGRMAEAIAARLGCRNTADILLVGDGSGSNWNRGVGWGCASYDFGSRETSWWWGAMNRGTVSIAEIMAYTQPLSFFASEVINKRSKRIITRVHILTDSQYCVQTGGVRDRAVIANAGLWSIFEVYRRCGLDLHWHHGRRDTTELNKLADAVSRAIRIRCEAFDQFDMAKAVRLAGLGGSGGDDGSDGGPPDTGDGLDLAQG